MSILDEAERIRLERVVPDLEKAVSAGLGGQALVEVLGQMKGRLAQLTDQFEGSPSEKKERKQRVAVAGNGSSSCHLPLQAINGSAEAV